MTDVNKVLGSVRKMCEQGNRVVFDDAGSFILNKKSGVVTPIEKRGATYGFDIWIQAPDTQEDPMQVDSFTEGQGSSSSSAQVHQAGDTFSTFLRHL